jgi:hypothetical protein
MSGPNVVEELRVTIAKMDEELRAVKLENTLLKNKITELISIKEPSPAQPSGGCFGYGADEF